MHVLIVGAGLGGLSLAQCLRKQGISFEIFERDQNEGARSQGWAFGTHSIIGDLEDAFPADMPDLKASTNHLAPLDLPAQMSMYFPGREGRLGVQDTPSNPIIRAERRRLRDWLAMKIPINWGKRVSSYEQHDHGVTVFFEDGTSAKGDLLVGADGVNSTVRRHLLQRPASEVLKLVPLMAVVGELNLSGDAFKRQLALGHSAHTYMDPTLGFFNFSGLHYVHPDGKAGRHYWMFMKPDPRVNDDDHWLRSATQQEKLEYVLGSIASLPPKLREIYELTTADGIKEEPHIWYDLELDALPTGRVILLGDAAHAMTPFRGEGGYHSFIDAMNLSKILGKVDVRDQTAINEAITGYNEEMLRRGSEAVRNSRNIQSAPKTADGVLNLVTANQVVRPLPEAVIA